MEDNWNTMKDFKPDEYELVNIMFDNDKIKPGWWTGQIWDARNKIIQNKVVAWKYQNKPYRRKE